MKHVEGESDEEAIARKEKALDDYVTRMKLKLRGETPTDPTESMAVDDDDKNARAEHATLVKRVPHMKKELHVLEEKVEVHGSISEEDQNEIDVLKKSLSDIHEQGLKLATPSTKKRLSSEAFTAAQKAHTAKTTEITKFKRDLEAAQERIDKAKVIVDKLTPALAALSVEEAALAKTRDDAQREMHLRSGKKVTVITQPPPVDTNVSTAMVNACHLLRTSFQAAPEVVKTKFFDQTEAGMTDEMLARFLSMAEDIAIFQQRGLEGIQIDDIVPLSYSSSSSIGEENVDDYIGACSDLPVHVELNKLMVKDKKGLAEALKNMHATHSRKGVKL